MTPLGKCTEGPAPSRKPETLADIVENARMLALARLVAARGCLDDIEAIDAGFDPAEIAAYREAMQRAGTIIEVEEPTVTSVLARALIENQVLRGRRDELLEANNRYQQEGRTARAEVVALRRIIIDAANALYGTAIVSPDVSTEFLRHIPNEVRLRIAALQDRGSAPTNQESECLRLIIANTAKALGTPIEPTASLTLLGRLPYASEMKMQLHRQNLGAYQAREHSVYEQLRAYGVNLTPGETMAYGVNTLGQRLRRAADAAISAGCALSTDGQSWVVPR